MIYQVRTNRTSKNTRVYVILKRIGQREGFLTKVFIKLFRQDRGTKTDKDSATEKLR